MDQLDTSTRILRAAEQLFGEVGFDGVSMRDIAQQADVNKALVFYHHDNKAELFRRVLRRFNERQTRALKAAMEETESDPPRERLKRMVDAYYEFIWENQRYPHLMYSTLTTDNEHSDIIREHMNRILGWVEDILSEECPEQGTLAGRQIFVTLAGASSVYVAYDPLFESVWDGDMMSRENLRERRDHLHWLIDTIVDRLEARD